MKDFKFKYSPAIWVLVALVIITSAIGFGWNVFNIIVTKEQGFKVVSYYIIAVLSLALLVLSISIAIYGKYIIKNGFLYSFFGLVKSKIEIKKIVEIVHFKKSDKLVVYLDNNDYTVIVISPELYNDFVLAIRNENSSIKFDIKIEGEDLPN